MIFIATAIDMISAPNQFSETFSQRWDIVAPNEQTLWFRLDTDDALGQRRYIPVAGSTISVIFQRADEFRTDGVSLNRLQSESKSITKVASANADDRSLWSINLTSADVSGILSGTVKFSLSESGVVTTWVQNFFLQKNLTNPGF